jgi:hypothetical protein
MDNSVIRSTSICFSADESAQIGTRQLTAARPVAWTKLADMPQYFAGRAMPSCIPAPVLAEAPGY